MRTCENCGASTTEPWPTREFGIVCQKCKSVLPWKPWNHSAEDISSVEVTRPALLSEPSPPRPE